MAKNLVIVESPAKADTIHKYLGRNYQVVASMGHIIDLPSSQIGVDIEHDFAPKYITIRGKGDLLAKLKKDAKTADRIYLATDPDREGEAISWHIANALKIPEGETCRITFNEITKQAVQAAIKAPRAIDLDLVDAQQARRILDRIVGYQISPLLWKKVKKGLSAGRVQSATLKMICDREAEIDAFNPEEYWTLDALLSAGNRVKDQFNARFYAIDGKKKELATKEETDAILAALEKALYTVTDVKEKQKLRHPAPPFTTSTMQQDASRKLNFPTKKTMAVAQQLYEGIKLKEEGKVGLITYMRTDSLRVSSQAQEAAGEYITSVYGKEYLPGKPNVYKTKAGAQDAHEAIRPTNVRFTPDSIKDSLTNEQYRLYKLIWSRFVASQMASAVLDTATAEICANGNDGHHYQFRASGYTIRFNGYMAVYSDLSEEDEKEKALPKLEAEQEVKLVELKGEQHFTQPPSRYTEATLVKTMEEKGIGRPSTYAPTISTIISRGYVGKEKKQLFPTELGQIVTDIMKDYFKDIVNVTFTANMEEELDQIAEGKNGRVAVLKEFYTGFEPALHAAEQEMERIEIKDEESDVICEKCGRKMVYKMGRYGKFLACPGFPECRNAKPIIKETGAKCPKCGGMILEKKSKKGKIYYGCEKNPECDFMMWDQPLAETCPTCGGLMAHKAGRANKDYCTECGFERSSAKKHDED
jgi:DNA topoisomerase-1